MCKTAMFKSAILIGAIFILIVTHIQFTKAGSMPGGGFDNETTTCEEFSRFARFNPFSVVDDEWMSFYYWAPPMSPIFAFFFVPTNEQKEYIKTILDGHVLTPVNWTANMLILRERDNSTYLMVEQDDRGHYLLYVIAKDLDVNDIVRAASYRFKQIDGGKYFAMFECKKQLVYMFARIKDIPKKDEIPDEVAKLCYKGRGGRSYLYQGHQWAPIPEADEEEFQLAMKMRKPVYRGMDI